MIEEIVELYSSPAAQGRYDEVVTQLEHALQCAQLATEAGASDELVVAALLHDIGHLLLGRASDDADLRHESLGAQKLGAVFGPRVGAAVGLHVSAKRYLCAVEPDYRANLSPASEQSLVLQGGPLGAAEVEAFEHKKGFADAVQVRRWDDLAKVPGAPTPDFDSFLPLLRLVGAAAL